MIESKVASFLTEASRVAGAFVAPVYAAGFLVVTLHLERFGVAELSFLRPHIFLAGILFVFLSALPVYSALQLWGYIGPARTVVPGGRPITRLTLYKLDLAIGFYAWCYVLGSSSFLLFEGNPFKHYWGVEVAVIPTFMLLAGAILGHWFYDRHPFKFILNTLLAVAALVVIVLYCYDRTFFLLTLWYYIVGVGTLAHLGIARDPISRGAFRWELITFYVLSLILFYSLKIYGGIKPQLGGGAPVPAVIYVSPKTPIFPSESAEILLLDETDKGYYVLLQSDQKSAYFIRRDLVTALRFRGR